MSEPTDTQTEEQTTASADGRGHAGAPAAVELAERKTLTSPVALLLFASALLLGILIAVALRPKQSDGISSGDPAVAAAKADIEARRNELNRQRVALGLPPLGGSSNAESVEDVASRIKKDVTTLTEISARFQQLLAESDAMAAEKRKELLSSEKTRQALSHENSRLMMERDKALSDSAAVQLQRSQLDLATKELEKLREQLAGAANRPSEASYEATKRQLEEANRAKSFFETRAKELEAKLADANPADMAKLRDEVARLQEALNKAHLFANSDNELLPQAVELCRSLRKLENKPDSEVSTAYSNFGANLGASVVKTLAFPTGSSTPSAEDQKSLPGIITGLPDEGLVLVVGYASRTGNYDDNHTLSSERATAVAQALSAAKRPHQMVQAVYIGQTARFSSRIPERNQLCEIWHIKSKADKPKPVDPLIPTPPPAGAPSTGAP